MEKYIFEVLAKYNKNANMKMNSIIEKLSEEEWNKEFDGYYKSIHELCSHNFWTGPNWLNLFKNMGHKKSLENELLDKKFTKKFDSIGEYLTLMAKIDDIIIDFVNQLVEDDLKSVLKFTTDDGTNYALNFRITLLHLFNHGTHCRAMISLYLEMLGKENDYNEIDIDIFA
jgi:uncharacterized damage-inducible protein DinB